MLALLTMLTSDDADDADPQMLWLGQVVLQEERGCSQDGLGEKSPKCDSAILI